MGRTDGVTFLYWCKVVKTGEAYHFMSQALLDIGITVKNDENEDCVIVDMAVEFPTHIAEIEAAQRDAMWW